MKTTSFTAAALLASAAIAQPHGHRHGHAKRDLVTDWETVWETVTVMVDESATETIQPAKATTTQEAGGQFIQSSSTSSSAAVEATAESVAEPSTSSTYVAALPSTTSSTSTPVVEPTTYVAPTTPSTTTQAAPTTTYSPVEVATSSSSTAEAAVATNVASSSTDSDGITYNQENTGDITYYTVGPGACGYDDSGKDDSENIVAIPHAFWDSISTLTSYGVDQPANPLCDKKIKITADGKSATATIRDRCGGCEGMAIDVTSHAFIELFGSTDAGRLDASWEIIQ
ncbi:hypothetical protein F5Y15DRAFT_212546 [Xylariaceae sp. FL0016]|nr:hypothetical protein F5Y15DRAFT_212546 [Xylariaceae sp. FL0016]